MFPKNIFIVGGGRWSRVLISVLCDILPKGVFINIISVHNSKQVAQWLKENEFEQQIKILSEWPEIDSKQSNVAIIVNAAKDHYRSAEVALNCKMPVFVEKPFTLSLKHCQHLVNLAEQLNLPLALSQIFLFTRYFEKYKDILSKSDQLESISVTWSDPKIEFRYGEKKSYDPGLPIYLDILPHILPLITQITSDHFFKCLNIGYFQGGSRVLIELISGEIPCKIEMVRNGNSRQRIIEVKTNEGFVKLDFSIEPGLIQLGNEIISGDPDWFIKPRPIETMLTTFFQSIATGHLDCRLDIKSGLGVYLIIEEIKQLYNQQQKIWLGKKISEADVKDDPDLQYAFNEILQNKEILSGYELEGRFGEISNFIHESKMGN